MNEYRTPLLAMHLQRIRHLPNQEYRYDESMQVNLTSDGGLACARSTKPFTNAQTPGHLIPSGFTPSGKWKPAKSVPSKMDKRVGK